MAMKPSKGDPLSPIRVMVVDDHAVVRGGLAKFLLAYDDLMLVGEAANGAEALQQVGQCAPDVMLMDLVMPEMDGATATRLIREQFPTVQVIALTSFKEDDLVQGVLAAGAIGYLLNQGMLQPDDDVTGVDYDEELAVVVVRTARCQIGSILAAVRCSCRGVGALAIMPTRCFSACTAPD